MTTPPPRPIGAPGHMGVDYEMRVDFDRLRRYRIERAQAAKSVHGDSHSASRPNTWR